MIVGEEISENSYRYRDSPVEQSSKKNALIPENSAIEKEAKLRAIDANAKIIQIFKTDGQRFPPTFAWQWIGEYLMAVMQDFCSHFFSAAMHVSHGSFETTL